MPEAAVRCRCRSEKCGHPNGQSCGNPVDNPVGDSGPVQDATPPIDPEKGPWVKAGYCEECWKSNPPPSLFKVWTDRLFQYFEEGK